MEPIYIVLVVVVVVWAITYGLFTGELNALHEENRALRAGVDAMWHPLFKKESIEDRQYWLERLSRSLEFRSEELDARVNTIRDDPDQRDEAPGDDEELRKITLEYVGLRDVLPAIGQAVTLMNEMNGRARAGANLEDLRMEFWEKRENWSFADETECPFTAGVWFRDGGDNLANPALVDVSSKIDEEIGRRFRDA